MADPDAEARFQQFINAPGSQGSRLRDAFAQLLAQGSDQAMPMEAMMAAQGRSQWPAPPPPTNDMMRPPALNNADAAIMKLEVERPQGYGVEDDVRVPMQIFGGDDRVQRFPVAGEPKPGEGEAPFGGKGLVVGPYELPKKKNDEKKKKKGKG